MEVELDVIVVESMVTDDWLLLGSSGGVVLCALVTIGVVWWHYNLPRRMLRTDVSVRLGRVTLAVLGFFCLILTALIVLIALLMLQGIWIPAQRWNFLGSAGLGLSVGVMIALCYYMLRVNIYMSPLRMSALNRTAEDDGRCVQG